MPESSELSEKTKEEIKDPAEKYSGLLGDVEYLPEPVKSVVWFIKKMTEEEDGST